MLEIRNLACLKGESLLFRGLNACIAPGEIVHLTGENGAGKTSLLRLLSGLVEPEQGEVLWQGLPIRSAHQGASPVHYLGHKLAVHDELSARENLRFLVAADGLIVPDAEQQRVLGEFGLGARSGRADLPMAVLSAGQRRRVGLARLVFAHGKPLWLLDEPMTALDVATAERVCELIDAHAAQGGVVVFTSHQPVLLSQPVREWPLGARV